MASDCMTVEFFDTLTRRDFDNGAIIDDLRRALKHRDALLDEIKVLRELADAVDRSLCKFEINAEWVKLKAAFDKWRKLKESEDGDV